MPVYNSQAFANIPGWHQITHAVLASNGPILDVSVSIPQALANLYARHQQPIPSPVTGIAMIDTGATRSCVHGPIMSQLGVNPIGVVTSGTVVIQSGCELKIETIFWAKPVVINALWIAVKVAVMHGGDYCARALEGVLAGLGGDWGYYNMSYQPLPSHQLVWNERAHELTHHSVLRHSPLTTVANWGLRKLPECPNCRAPRRYNRLLWPGSRTDKDRNQPLNHGSLYRLRRPAERWARTLLARQ